MQTMTHSELSFTPQTAHTGTNAGVGRFAFRARFYRKPTMSGNNTTDDDSTANNYDDDMFADVSMNTEPTDTETADSIDYDNLTEDDPKALVSGYGDTFHVIGMDHGETQYANDIPSETGAQLIAETINAARENNRADDTKFIVAGDETDTDFEPPETFETNAERIAQDDDVLFAITREDPPEWAGKLTGYAVWFGIGLLIAGFLNAAHYVFTAVFNALSRTNGDNQ